MKAYYCPGSGKIHGQETQRKGVEVVLWVTKSPCRLH